jgi:hypothetical protein
MFASAWAGVHPSGPGCDVCDATGAGSKRGSPKRLGRSFYRDFLPSVHGAPT